MKPRTILYILLIIFNLGSLYFIITLFGYDEIVGYLLKGGRKIIDPRKLAYLLFLTCLLNLYFLSLILIEKSFENKS